MTQTTDICDPHYLHKSIHDLYMTVSHKTIHGPHKSFHDLHNRHPWSTQQTSVIHADINNLHDLYHDHTKSSLIHTRIAGSHESHPWSTQTHPWSTQTHPWSTQTHPWSTQRERHCHWHHQLEAVFTACCRWIATPVCGRRRSGLSTHGYESRSRRPRTRSWCWLTFSWPTWTPTMRTSSASPSQCMGPVPSCSSPPPLMQPPPPLHCQCVRRFDICRTGAKAWHTQTTGSWTHWAETSVEGREALHRKRKNFSWDFKAERVAVLQMCSSRRFQSWGVWCWRPLTEGFWTSSLGSESVSWLYPREQEGWHVEGWKMWCKRSRWLSERWLCGCGWCAVRWWTVGWFTLTFLFQCTAEGWDQPLQEENGQSGQCGISLVLVVNILVCVCVRFCTCMCVCACVYASIHCMDVFTGLFWSVVSAPCWSEGWCLSLKLHKNLCGVAGLLGLTLITQSHILLCFCGDGADAWWFLPSGNT